MKKSILIALSLVYMSAYVFADGLTATLQQGESMKAFYGDSAFIKAYAEAQDSAIITLSSGLFRDVDTIAKSITLIGTYAFDVTNPTTTILSKTTIMANDVKLEGIYFSGNVTLGEVSNSHIKRCWIQGTLQSIATHTNTVVEQSLIRIDKAIAQGSNYCLKNCAIDKFGTTNTTNNVAFITNCYIFTWSHAAGSYSYYQPYAIYKNNILGRDCYASNASIVLESPSEFYNNYFYLYTTYRSSSSVTGYTFASGCINSGNTQTTSSNIKIFSSALTVKMDTTSFRLLGMDGTPIGITGGTGFSEYPAIPRITSKEIDSNTDEEGKIKVKITVQAQQ